MDERKEKIEYKRGIRRYTGDLLTVTINLPRTDAEELREIVAKKGLQLGVFARMLLLDWLEREKKGNTIFPSHSPLLSHSLYSIPSTPPPINQYDPNDHNRRSQRIVEEMKEVQVNE